MRINSFEQATSDFLQENREEIVQLIRDLAGQRRERLQPKTRHWEMILSLSNVLPRPTV